MANARCSDAERNLAANDLERARIGAQLRGQQVATPGSGGQPAPAIKRILPLLCLTLLGFRQASRELEPG